MTVADKILFTCTACSYKARIPAHYSGRSIHCPKCKTVQEVGAVSVADDQESAPDIAAPSTPAPGQGKIVFTCPACSYKGRLAAEYDGKTIRCPGCQAPQLVKGEAVTSPIVASMAADENVFKTGESEKIRFECNACGYRAKIPSKYAGKPIHCPQCKEVQQVKAETDLEAATGRTVTIARVSPAKVREPKLAMTNVGIAFECTVCGYASKISPSCAGDAVYCPSCRSPQKVEWGDPDEEEMLAEDPADAGETSDDAADDAVAEPAPPVAPPSATALSLQLGVNNTPLANPVLPAAAPVPVAAVAAPAAPVAPVAAVAPARARSPEPQQELAHAPETTSAAAPARTSAVQRPRRSVRSASDSDEAAPAPRAEATPSPASKLPVVIVGVLALVFLAVAVVLFVQVGDLKQALAAEQSKLATQTQATATEAAARQAAEGERDAAIARAETQEIRADAAEQRVSTLTVQSEALATENKTMHVEAAALEATINTLKAELDAATKIPAATDDASKKP